LPELVGSIHSDTKSVDGRDIQVTDDIRSIIEVGGRSEHSTVQVRSTSSNPNPREQRVIIVRIPGVVEGGPINMQNANTDCVIGYRNISMSCKPVKLQESQRRSFLAFQENLTA